MNAAFLQIQGEIGHRVMRTEVFEKCFEHFKNNTNDFICVFVTMTETWGQHHTPRMTTNKRMDLMQKWSPNDCLEEDIE